MSAGRPDVGLKVPEPEEGVACQPAFAAADRIFIFPAINNALLGFYDIGMR